MSEESVTPSAATIYHHEMGGKGGVVARVMEEIHARNGARERFVHGQPSEAEINSRGLSNTPARPIGEIALSRSRLTSDRLQDLILSGLIGEMAHRSSASPPTEAGPKPAAA